MRPQSNPRVPRRDKDVLDPRLNNVRNPDTVQLSGKEADMVIIRNPHTLFALDCIPAMRRDAREGCWANKCTEVFQRNLAAGINHGFQALNIPPWPADAVGVKDKFFHIGKLH